METQVVVGVDYGTPSSRPPTTEFEPDHPAADEDGFRRDVLELTRELGVSTVRYPGGNFVLRVEPVGPRQETREYDLNAGHPTPGTPRQASRAGHPASGTVTS